MSDNNATPQTPFGNDPQSQSSSSAYPQGTQFGYDQTPQASPAAEPNPFQPQQPDAAGYAQQPVASAGQQYSQTSQPADVGQPYAQQPQPNPYEQDHPYAQNAQNGPEFIAPNPYAQTGYGYAGGAAGGPQSGQLGQPYPPQGYAYPYPLPANQRWNTMCIVGFILAFVFAPVGVVLSVIAMIQISRSGEKSRGIALAGIIVGAVNTVILVMVIVAIAVGIGSFMDAVERGYTYSDDSYSTDCTLTIDGQCVGLDELYKYGIDPDDLDDLRGLQGLLPGLEFNGQSTGWDGAVTVTR
ncbi:MULTISPECIES: DUF4190 domain-containing protein [Bifidobacterium]|uniref:DUF4190 domain-containing protein n=1 Tax=Bifidobacterium TaxID=1678 RepID=UPI001BDCE09F|nr:MULTISPECIES: DUF4190 domain-containing protein [Bifidobacterium]MBT1161959.1 DUF4190 domain-containing protein [Bifidobacterium sp. SO1]MBW3079137.1 DUF4190 domain-containing protein [Bifidobacterium simiiventris]